MPNRYFDKFPIINYNGFNIINLTTSAMLVDKYVNIPYIYTQYELGEQERADNVANSFYDDPYMTWIIFYANKIVDPYYQWYLPDDDFNTYIEQKYGSIDVAQRKISAFVSNWFSDDRELSKSDLDKLFGEYKGLHSNYWTPVYDEDFGNLLYYARKQDTYINNTNKLVRIEVADSSNFSIGDLITIKEFTNGVGIGSAEISDIRNNFITLKHVLDQINNNYYIFNDNGDSTQITDYLAVEDFTENVWTKKAISDEEMVYWTPLYYYDLEKELNNYKKTIKLVDAKLAVTVANKLSDDLNGN